MVEWSLWMLMSLLLTAEFGVDKMNYFRRPNFYQWEEFTGKSLHKSKCLEVDKLELNDMKFTEAAYFKRSRESYHMELKEILVGSQFSSVQSLSRVQLFVTPCTAACPASLSITNSRSLLKLMPIKSMMPSDHLILCHPLLLQPSNFPSIRVVSLTTRLMSQFFASGGQNIGVSASVLPIERLLLNRERHRESWPPEERNSIQGQWRGLITQSFCVTKFN